MRNVLIFSIILLLSTPCFAKIVLNPDTNEISSVSDSSTLQYNYMTDEHEYAEPDSTHRYNGATDRYELAPEGYTVQPDPSTATFRYLPDQNETDSEDTPDESYEYGDPLSD